MILAGWPAGALRSFGSARISASSWYRSVVISASLARTISYILFSLFRWSLWPVSSYYPTPLHESYSDERFLLSATVPLMSLQQIQLRNGTAAEWNLADPILLRGEFGYETNTTKFKIGDGVTPWSSLNYNISSFTLVNDGDILTRTSGSLARLTRSQLAADPAFTTVYSPIATVTAAAVHGVYAFTTAQRQALSGTNRPVGRVVYDTDLLAMMFWDSVGWIITSETAKAYTGTVTNITVGTGGTNVATYQRANGWCDVTHAVVLGSAGVVVGSGPTFLLPFAPLVSQYNALAPAFLLDFSTSSTFIADITVKDTTSVEIRGRNTNSGTTTISAALPFTWAASDGFFLNYRYRMSSRYTA